MSSFPLFYTTTAECRSLGCLFHAEIREQDNFNGRIAAQSMATEVGRGHVNTTGHRVSLSFGTLTDARVIGPYCDACRKPQDKSALCEACMFGEWRSA